MVFNNFLLIQVRKDPAALTSLLLWFCLGKYFKFSSHITQEIFLVPFNVRFVLFVSLFVCVFVLFSCQVSYYVVGPPFCNYFENSFSITSILPRRTSRFIPPTLFKRRRLQLRIRESNAVLDRLCLSLVMYDIVRITL